MRPYLHTILPHKNMTMTRSNIGTDNIVLDSRTFRLESTQKSSKEEGGTVLQGSVSPAKYHDGSYLHCKLEF